MNESSIERSKPLYFDRKIGWFLYPMIGLSFIFFANDNDFKTLIYLPSFKWDVLFSMIVASIIGLYLGGLTRYLDKYHHLSWEAHFKSRMLLQVLFGMVVPIVVIIGLEVIYLIMIRVPVRESSIFNLELPLSLIYLFIINLIYYFNYTSFSYRKQLKEKDQAKTTKIRVKIIEGAQEKLMPIENIAFLRSADKLLWLHTFQKRQFPLNGSLKEWEEKLPKDYFYRLNRQIIAHRNAIQGIESTETRRLKVLIKDFDDEIFIPKTKATAFRKWWQN